eukprot:sb/3476896/
MISTARSQITISANNCNISQDTAPFDYTLFVLHIILVVVWMAGFVTVIIKFTKSGIKERKSRRSLRSQMSSRRIMLNTTARVTPEAGNSTGAGNSTAAVPEVPGEEMQGEEQF